MEPFCRPILEGIGDSGIEVWNKIYTFVEDFGGEETGCIHCFVLNIVSSAPLPLQTRHHHSSSSSSSSSTCCFSICFGRSAAIDDGTHSPVTPSRSPSSSFRSKASEHMKCPSFISKIGKRRHHSADFRYDPLSYALNFDEGFSDDTPVAAAAVDNMRYRGFAARLPASPPSSRFSTVQRD